MDDISNTESVCVIPARGGSKRIPGKNIKPFCGKPMLQRSIEVALEAACFSHVLVSTDSAEISDLALKCGALVPFVRPSELANDHSDTRSVIRHAIDYMGQKHPELDRADLPVCCLYAAAPFVEAQSLRSGLALLSEAEFVVPVASFAHPIQRALRSTDDGVLSMFSPEEYSMRSQDLDDAWHDIGQFYWARRSSWQSDIDPFQMKARAMKVPRWRAQDIDTPEDWQHAEALFMALQKAA